jgi:hypothetical protein
MENAALLAELRALANSAPDLEAYKPTSQVHHQWFGKLYALMAQWDPLQAEKVLQWIDSPNNEYNMRGNSGNLLSLLYRAIAVVETQTPAQTGQAFGPGAAYDFFKTLRDLLATATRSVLIVDPYLDATVFDEYLTSVSQRASVRLLTLHYATALKPAVTHFIAQTHMRIEARKSSSIHDRVIFLDDSSCWVLGQSIKDAANKKPTYLAPLDAEMTKLKKDDYEKIWIAAEPI